MGVKRIRIIKTPGQRAKVTNPHQAVSIGERDQVNFVAIGTKATIFFPRQIFVTPDPHFIRLSGSSPCETGPLSLIEGVKANEEIYYAVWVDEDRNFVEVGSHPSIITDP